MNSYEDEDVEGIDESAEMNNYENEIRKTAELKEK